MKKYKKVNKKNMGPTIMLDLVLPGNYQLKRDLLPPNIG